MTKLPRNQAEGWPDVHPYSPTARWEPNAKARPKGHELSFSIAQVAPLVGLQSAFIKRALGHGKTLSLKDVESLLMLDEMSETFVPRSRIVEFLLAQTGAQKTEPTHQTVNADAIVIGDARTLIASLPDDCLDCVVTSTPYWAVRIYGTPHHVKWADGEICPLGHEQTPEGFIRHSVELLFLLKGKLKDSGSLWWNLGDTYHTRTQIRGNAYETLKAMKGMDGRKWTEHGCRRFSGGHSYLIDGGQCLIPQQIAMRAARIGYIVKSMITWRKDTSLPEPTQSRVSRSLEHIIHLSKTRNPYFDKNAFLETPPELGGRDPAEERGQATDVWHLKTSDGRDGHGAQFPVALPGRCISLSTRPGDLVLDPFIGSGTTAIAAKKLGRRFLGFEISPEYAKLASSRIAGVSRLIR